MSNSYNHILKYTGLFGGAQVLTVFANLVRNKVMAVLLSTQGLGLNSMLYAAQMFASQCTNLGLSFGAVPRLSDSFEQNDVAQIRYHIQMTRLWSMIAALFGLVFCVAIAPLLGRFTFTWGHFGDHYATLSVSVAALAITGGETAILKATRRLGMLARIQFYAALASVAISLPLYYFMGYSGILPSIILMTFFTTLATLSYSYRCYPLRLSFQRSMLHDGLEMIRLGVAFILAAAVGSGAEMFIRSYLNIEGGLSDVGLYNAGYMIAITYAGMVFSAMETDYFPRLSGVANDIQATNETVNKQMEVSLLLLSPMLMALMVLLPALIPVLFSMEFLSVIAMAQVAVLAMYFKVMTLPVAYITLARRRSLAFLLLESSYFVVLVIAVAVGYRQADIFGAGVGVVVAHVFDYLLINIFAYYRYDYRCTWPLMGYAVVQLSIACVAYWVTCTTDGVAYWMIETALTLVSTAYSITILHQKTRLWEALRKKLF